MLSRWRFAWGAFLIGCMSAFAAPPTKTPIVFVSPAKTSPIFDTLTYPARLIPTINAALLSEADGIVEKVLIPLGRPARRGETVLVVRNTDPVYKYAPMRVTAPVSGVVSAIEVTEGARVQRNQRLGSVTDPSKIKIAIELASSDLAVISPGMLGELSVSILPETVPVKVLGVSPFVDPATGTATGELTWANTKTIPKLPPGLVGRAIFRVREHKGIELPDHAITYRGAEPFARVIEDGKAKFKPVVLGQVRRGMVEVLKGIVEGEKVILRASTFVGDGETVDVQEVGGKKS